MLETNLIKIYEQSFRENGELPALTDYFKRETLSYHRMACQIAGLHRLFIDAGIERGDRIALLGRNNPRWCITWLAAITYGAVIVPILQDFNSNDIIHILNHSESRMLMAGDNFWDIVEPDRVPGLECAFSLTDFHLIWDRRDRTLAFEQAEPIPFPEVSGDEVVLINYTSGTTGYSKGVMLTVNNLTTMVEFARGEKIFFQGGRVLSFLPLAHAYGCAFDFLCPMAQGVHVTLLGKIPAAKILMEAMTRVRPHIVCCVPLVLEKIYRKQVAPLLEKGPMRLALKLPLVDRGVYATIRKKLLDAFGGEVSQFIVGGAALGVETEEFLMRIKFPLTVGYGMTETSPLISYSYWTDFKAGSVGRVLDKYLEVKIESPDAVNVAGELLVKGEQVMKGYYKNEAATREVLKDGWLHTGDIATLDADGTLYIKGRSKTMILSPSGQNIYPEQIEAKLNNLYLVMESLVVERNGRLTALVYPDYETAANDGVVSEAIPEIMERNLSELNTLVAPYERLASINIYPTEFEKTPKKSIRRYLYQI